MYLNVVDTSVCLQEVDGKWNISWPHATRGQMIQQKCPGGAESLGIHYNFNIKIVIFLVSHINYKFY